MFAPVTLPSVTLVQSFLKLGQRNLNSTGKFSINNQQPSYSAAEEGEEPVIAGCKCLHWPGNCKLPLIAPNCWHWFSSSGTGTANVHLQTLLRPPPASPRQEG